MANDETGETPNNNAPAFYPWQKRLVDQGKKISPAKFYEMYDKYGKGNTTVRTLCAEYGISRARFYQLKTKLESYLKTGLKTKEVPKEVRDVTGTHQRTFNLRELRREKIYRGLDDVPRTITLAELKEIARKLKEIK